GGRASPPSRSAAVRLIETGNVTVDGETVSKKHIVRAGELVTVTPADMAPPALAPEHIPLDIRYEDEHLIVLSKEAGMGGPPPPGD
ncbi:MAG TPA: RluA family pseudouridine synthase, partial [Marinobacter sp.]|nr:RluA family pseudouridine synthase [Marinobacter sp.]